MRRLEFAVVFVDLKRTDWVDLSTTRTELVGRIGLLADSNLNRHSTVPHLEFGLRKPLTHARHGRTDPPKNLIEGRRYRSPVAGRGGSRARAACSLEGRSESSCSPRRPLPGGEFDQRKSGRGRENPLTDLGSGRSSDLDSPMGLRCPAHPSAVFGRV